MNMFMLTNMNNMLRTQKLEMMWNQRKKDITKKQPLNQDPEVARRQAEVARLQEDAMRVRKGNIIAGMDAKLKAGQSLSPQELAYLKENSPALYEEAVKLQAEREQYKKELENCRTQEEVEQLKARKLQGFLNTTQTIMQNPNIPKGKKQELMDKVLRRLMMVELEHRQFVGSDRYQTLPKDEDELRGKKDKDGNPIPQPEDKVKELPKDEAEPPLVEQPERPQEPQAPDRPPEGNQGAEPPKVPEKGKPAPPKDRAAPTADPGVEIRRMAASLSKPASPAPAPAPVDNPAKKKINRRA